MLPENITFSLKDLESQPHQERVSRTAASGVPPGATILPAMGNGERRVPVCDGMIVARWTREVDTRPFYSPHETGWSFSA